MKYRPEAIKELRLKLGLRLEEVAERARLGERNLRNLERGFQIPKADTLAKLATALRVPVSQFFAA